MRSYVTIQPLRSIYQIDRYREQYQAEQDARRAKAPPPPPEFTPQQQLALLMLLRSDLSKLVVGKLLQSTVRVTERHFHELVAMGYVQRKPSRQGHQLLSHARLKTHHLAEDLAKELGIARPEPILTVAEKRRHRAQQNGLSQNGNW